MDNRVIAKGLLSKKVVTQVLFFLLHQFIATVGIDVLAAYLTSYTFDVFRVFGKSFPSQTMFWILTGTPYYPVQIGLALSLGWLIARRTPHRVMLWVWVLPLAYLTYAVIAIPTLVPQFIPPAYQAGIGESRITHYFGWGCGARPCFDQNALTVIFYIAAAYSIGALLARKVPPSRRSSSREFWIASVMALVFFSVAVLEGVLIFRQAHQWKLAYLPLILTPIGLSAFLILYGMLQRGTLRLSRAR